MCLRAGLHHLVGRKHRGRIAVLVRLVRGRHVAVGREIAGFLVHHDPVGRRRTGRVPHSRAADSSVIRSLVCSRIARSARALPVAFLIAKIGLLLQTRQIAGLGIESGQHLLALGQRGRGRRLIGLRRLFGARRRIDGPERSGCDFPRRRRSRSGRPSPSAWAVPGGWAENRRCRRRRFPRSRSPFRRCASSDGWCRCAECAFRPSSVFRLGQRNCASATLDPVATAPISVLSLFGGVETQIQMVRRSPWCAWSARSKPAGRCRSPLMLFTTMPSAKCSLS